MEKNRGVVRRCTIHLGGLMRVSVFPFLLSAVAVCAATPTWAAAQEPVTLSGRVMAMGAPIGYAEVVIPSLGLGANTRDDGRYAIVIPSARAQAGQTITVVARRLGYKPTTVQVALKSGVMEQDFNLAPNPLQLGEVVVTGAGTTSTTEKLGSVRNNVPADQIVKSNEQNVVEALAAKAPNVFVSAQSGDPGASSFIQIRGIRTIVGNNQPLIVVDGVPINNSAKSTSDFNPHDGGYSGEGTVVTNRAMDLNPNDIESVEILKGAAAGRSTAPARGRASSWSRPSPATPVRRISRCAPRPPSTTSTILWHCRRGSARDALAWKRTLFPEGTRQASSFMASAMTPEIVSAGAPGARSSRRASRCSITRASFTRRATSSRTR